MFLREMSRFGINFDSLRELHDSVNKLLDSPDTKLEIIHHGHQKSAHEISEASLRLADSCAAAKDLLLLAKDHIHHLQSAFRRIAVDTAASDRGGANFSPYRRPRKQLKKAILKRLNSLKGMKSALPPQEEEGDQNLKTVADMLNEVSETTLLIVRSLLSLIALPGPDGKPEPVRKDPVFRLKLRRADSFSFWEKCDAADVRTAAKRLEEVDVVVEDMEAELERIFRRLIRTRAELLNILTT